MTLAGAGRREIVTAPLDAVGWSHTYGNDGTLYYTSDCRRFRAIHSAGKAPGYEADYYGGGWRIGASPEPEAQDQWTARSSPHTPGEIIVSILTQLSLFPTDPFQGDPRVWAPPCDALDALGWSSTTHHDEWALEERHVSPDGHSSFVHLDGDMALLDACAFLTGGRLLKPEPLWRIMFTEGVPDSVLNTAIQTLTSPTGALRKASELPDKLGVDTLTAERPRFTTPTIQGPGTRIPRQLPHTTDYSSRNRG
ncbi:DUF317 domain-containing protein [Streptomyces sp. NPDC051561]|uniref:DUF317 domain-containing protein n=1 Tax=Streptomyces sp. NPDC051561 TaxID=3365658 RepID=UPI0037AFE4F2